MYKMSKAVKLTEQIELDDGIVLDVKVNIGLIADNFNKLYNKIIMLQKNKHVDSSLGEAVIELMEMTLGKNNSDILLEYYEGDWFELIGMVVPFVDYKVIPLIKRHNELKAKDAKQLYKAKRNVK